MGSRCRRRDWALDRGICPTSQRARDVPGARRRVDIGLSLQGGKPQGGRPPLSPHLDHLVLWIIEFDSIDPIGTAFRYADDQASTLRYAEIWVDFVQLKFAMGRVFEMLDAAILRELGRGSIGTSSRSSPSGA